jgi:hypothetical protein
MGRPADKLSVSQNLGNRILVLSSPSVVDDILSVSAALAATGFIWVRYSLVITPINYSLAGVSTRLPSNRRREFKIVVTLIGQLLCGLYGSRAASPYLGVRPSCMTG